MNQKINIVFLLCFLLPGVTFAQSKKKIYNNLLIECAVLERENDSIYNLYLKNDDAFKSSYNAYSKLCSTVSNYAGKAASSQKEFERTVDDHNRVIELFGVKSESPIILADQEAIPVLSDQDISKFMRSQVPAVPNKIQLNEKEKIAEKSTALTSYKNNLLNWRLEALKYNDQLLSETNVLKAKTSDLRTMEKRYVDLLDQTNNARESVIDAILSMVTELKKSGKKLDVPLSLEPYFFEYDKRDDFGAMTTAYNDHSDFVPQEDVKQQIQEPAEDENVVYEVVDEPAQFPGGIGAMKLYLAENVRYPQKALEMGIQGTTYLKFVVSKSGNISNVKVLRGVPDCPDCDKEAERVVRSMPNWKPGKLNEQEVHSWYNLPVRFKLGN